MDAILLRFTEKHGKVHRLPSCGQRPLKAEPRLFGSVSPLLYHERGSGQRVSAADVRNMKSFTLLSLLAAGFLLAVAQCACAQFGNQIGMTKDYGNMSGLSSGSLSPGLGQSSNYGMFGSRTLGGGFNPAQSSFGGGGAGALGGGMPAGLGLQNQQAAGSITGNERFLRQNQRPGQFVGNDSAQAQSFVGAMSQLMGNRNGFGNQNNFGQGQNRNRQNQNRNGRNRQERSPIQRVYVADFGSAGPVSPAIASRLSKQLSESHKLTGGPIQAALQGQTVILQGVVASNHERDLAAQMAMLEPGVAKVQNDLQVLPPPTETDLPAPDLPAPVLPSSANSRLPR
ncbi:MAG: BON domain-containing protein [Pirellulales bacterium]|nr:BON domain-containing protein [Pirellulales bacterium]